MRRFVFKFLPVLALVLLLGACSERAPHRRKRKERRNLLSQQDLQFLVWKDSQLLLPRPLLPRVHDQPAEVVEVHLHLLFHILVEHLAHMKLHLTMQLLSIQQKHLIFIIHQNQHHNHFIIRLVKKEQTRFLVHLQL